MHGMAQLLGVSGTQPSLKAKGFGGRAACFSGSTYPATREQICYSQQRGLRVVTLKMAPFLRGFFSKEEVIGNAFEECAAVAALGNFILVPRVLPEDEGPDVACQVLELLVECASRVCREIEFDNLAVIGGETSGALLRKLGVRTLRICGMPEMSVATGTILDGIPAGRLISLKGGSVGSNTALERMQGRPA